jgi:hypothetical protein
MKDISSNKVFARIQKLNKMSTYEIVSRNIKDFLP